MDKKKLADELVKLAKNIISSETKGKTRDGMKWRSSVKGFVAVHNDGRELYINGIKTDEQRELAIKLLNGLSFEDLYKKGKKGPGAVGKYNPHVKVIYMDKVKIPREFTSAEWFEDEDVDEGRDRAIREFKKHTGGEPVYTAEKIKGNWFPVTTELGAYRIGKKYRVDWKDIGEHQGHRGKWYVKI